MDFPNSEFWNYSKQLWSLPEVDTLCLELQNQYDINVNILLFCYWVGSQNLSLSEDDIQTLIDTAQPWQTIITPLRDSRKLMQQHLIAIPANMVNQTVSNISEMEINAEHMTQISLEKALKPERLATYKNKNEVECSFNNIKLYLNALESNTHSNEIIPTIISLHEAIFQDGERVQKAATTCM